MLKFGSRELCVRLHWRTCDVARPESTLDRDSHRSIRERQTNSESRGSAFYEIIGATTWIESAVDYHISALTIPVTEMTALIKSNSIAEVAINFISYVPK